MANILSPPPKWLQDGLRFEAENLAPGREDSIYGFINGLLSSFFPARQQFMIIPPNGRAQYDIPLVSQKSGKLLIDSYRHGPRLRESRDEKSRLPSSLSSKQTLPIPMMIAF